jgi:mannose-6-phosphate isomerase-like protein (cupin superfamily)
MAHLTRRNLLYFFGATSVTPLLPAQMMAPTGKVSFAKPGEGRFAFSDAQQAQITPCKLTSEDSGGTLSAFEIHVMPQRGPQLHVHHREDEWYYVLSGEFLFKAGGEQQTLTTGGSIWLPRGIPHTWANMSSAEAKLILVCQPGGFERFFDEIGREMVDVHDAEAATRKMRDVMAKYGMELLGPPLFKGLRQLH